MTRESEVAADRVACKVLEALQEADEMGGPDRREYIGMMEKLARICMLRADTARADAPELRVLKWARDNIHPDAFIEHTGGGCTALQIPASGTGTDAGDYWWITDDASAPESMVAGDEPFYISLYRGGQDAGEQWVGFWVSSMAAARDLIRSLTGVQW